MDVVRERDENWATAGNASTKTVTSYQLTRTGNIGGILARTRQISGQADRHSFHSYDGTGNVVSITDASQNVQCAYAYSGFGLEKVQEASGWGQPYRYSTKWQHQSGLVDYGFRFYNPAWGRWINRDPIGENGGANTYGMVANDPINYGDPNGLWGVQFGSGPNIGVGNPSLIFDQGAVNRGGQGAQAAVDGIIPFADPFADAGGYNACDSDLQFSWKAGAFSRDVLLIAATSGAGAGGGLGLTSAPGEAGHFTPGLTQIFINRIGVRQLAAQEGLSVQRALYETAYHEALHRGIYPAEWAIEKVIGRDPYTLGWYEKGVEALADSYGGARGLLRTYGIK